MPIRTPGSVRTRGLFQVRTRKTFNGQPINGKWRRYADWQDGVAGPMPYREAAILAATHAGVVEPYEAPVEETPQEPVAAPVEEAPTEEPAAEVGYHEMLAFVRANVSDDELRERFGSLRLNKKQVEAEYARLNP